MSAAESERRSGLERSLTRTVQVLAALIAAVLAIALPHRRVTRLDPDEF